MNLSGQCLNPCKAQTTDNRQKDRKERQKRKTEKKDRGDGSSCLTKLARQENCPPCLPGRKHQPKTPMQFYAALVSYTSVRKLHFRWSLKPHLKCRQFYLGPNHAILDIRTSNLAYADSSFLPILTLSAITSRGSSFFKTTS
jgi:hypothetical protein